MARRRPYHLPMYGDIDRDRLSIITGALLLALALARFVETPTRPLVHLTIFGSPVTLNLSAVTVMGIIVAGLCVTGMATLLANHPQARDSQLPYQFMYWLTPGLLGPGLVFWLSRIGSVTAWAVALLLCAALLSLAMVVEFAAVDAGRRQQGWRQWAQTGMIYLTAVLLFTLIYSARARSLLSGTAVLLVAALLAARLLWLYTPDAAQAFRLGGVVGLIMGQMTWLWNYWRLSGLQGGLYLLILFYVTAGILQQYLQGQLQDRHTIQRILLEYGAVAVVALALITTAVP